MTLSHFFFRFLLTKQALIRVIYVSFATLFCKPLLADIDPSLFLSKISQKKELVPEFRFIQEEAKKMGVKVYLFGGSAAAFAHYVKWDLERQQGDSKYQEALFDYDFTNIYRGNQDLDLVVDGTLAQARALKKTLQAKYPHFIGNKESWEVRLLRSQIGDKSALLNDPNFLKQHTDSNSTGLIELSDSEADFVFRDLHDWNNPHPLFLKDVLSDKITYLFSDEHEKTVRFKEGKNPPIFSALRYLAKLTQYELQGTSDDLKLVKKIVKETDFEELSSYVQHKLEEFALKTLLNSPDSERSWNILEKTGLRKKLIEMDGNKINVKDSLSWWLSKEPLRSKELGTEGKTAQEIFGDEEIIVAHETDSFIAFENITRSSHGKANVFISREDTTSENAAHGDGFYTQLGLTGARGTGFTIRFKLNPKAIEGVDFKKEGNFIIFFNKNALTLIRDRINVTAVDLIDLIFEDNISLKEEKGWVERLKRKFRNSKEISTFEDVQNFLYYIADKIDIEAPPITEGNLFNFLNEDVDKRIGRMFLENHDADIFSFIGSIISPFLIENPEIIKNALSKIDNKTIKFIAEYFLSHPGWEAYPEIAELIIENDDPKIKARVIFHMLKYDHWKIHPYLVQKLIDLKDPFIDYKVVEFILSRSHWITNHEWIDYYLDQNTEQSNKNLAYYVLSHPLSANHPRLMDTLLKRNLGDQVDSYIANALLAPSWRNRSDIVETLIKRNRGEFSLSLNLALLFNRSQWADHPELLKKLVKTKHSNHDLLMYTLGTEVWNTKHPNVIEKIIAGFLEKNNPSYDNRILTNVLSKKYWAHKEDWLNTISERPDSDPYLARVLSYSHWAHRDDLVDLLVKRGEQETDVISFILGSEHWSHRTDLVKYYIDQGYTDIIMYKVLSKDFWRKDATLLAYFLDSTHITERNFNHHISHWAEHPDVQAYLNGKVFNLENWRSQKKSFTVWKSNQQNHTAYSCKSMLID